MLGALPLTPEGLRKADPPLPFPLALQVLQRSLEKRIGEFGAEPDYGKVLATWGGKKGEKKRGKDKDENFGDDEPETEKTETRARAERAVRASSLLRRGELALLRKALEATRSLLLVGKGE